MESRGPPIETGEAKRTPQAIQRPDDARRGASLDDVSLALAGNSAQVVDARPAERFRGEAPEPRPGVRSGHMPRFINVPSTDWSRTAG